MRKKQLHPRQRKKKYRIYSPTSLTNAYLAIKENKISVKRASRQYNVPETTLRQRVLGRVHIDTVSSGTQPLLSQEEEAQLVNHLKSMARIGYGHTRAEVVQIASQYAVSLNKRDKDHPLSLKWFRRFMKRCPELGVHKPRSLSLARAKATSREAVQNYFSALKEVMDKYDLHDKPESIYNVDEKGLQTEHTPPNIVGPVNSSVSAITSSRSSITTVIGCGNALGNQLPPYFIFKGQRMRQELMKGSSEGAVGVVTESGWSNSQAFRTYLETHFLRYVQRKDQDQQVLLLYDGHKSHISIDLIQWAKLHNIILFVLPAHTSHVLQPLDLGCFGPFQKIYNSECHKFIRENPSSAVTKFSVCSLACSAYTHALSPLNLQSSFRKSGIYPFNSSAVDEIHFAPSEVLSVERDSDSVLNGQNVPVTGDSSQSTSQSVSIPCIQESFFLQKMNDVMNIKQLQKSKTRRNLGAVVSGKPITEDETVKNIQDYHKDTDVHVKSKAKSSSSGTKISNSSKQPVKRKASDPKHGSSKQSITKMKKMNEKDPVSPQPGPSKLPSADSSDYFDSDSESTDTDEERCCVCNQHQPMELRHSLSIIFVKWAKCDYENCTHWTHLKYCCDRAVIRLNDKFICPYHD